MHGLFGSPRYLELVAAEHRRLDRLLARDPLRLRRLVPRARCASASTTACSRGAARCARPARGSDRGGRLRVALWRLGASLDLVAVCRGPLPA